MSKRIESATKIIMNGPVEFDMKIWVINDETEQAGQVVVGLGMFTYPSKAEIVKRLAKFEAEQLVGSLAGFRLMTKKEMFQAVTYDKLGEAVSLAASDEWDAIVE